MGFTTAASEAGAGEPGTRPRDRFELQCSITAVMTTRVRRWQALLACCASAALVPTGSAVAAPSVAATRRAADVAYIYGLPLIEVLHTLKLLPVNAAVSSGVLANASVRLVLLPNRDTLYTLAHLDLRAQPQVLHVPDTHGRYYTMQLLDAYTNVIANVGRRSTGTAAGDFAIVGPGWRGRLPAGVHKIRSPTPDVWVLGRTLVTGPADVGAVRALQARYTVFGLSALGTPAEPRSSVVLTRAPSFAPAPPPRGLAFLDELGQALRLDPPPPRDAALLRVLAQAGIGAGRVPSRTTEPALRSAWKAGLADGARRLARYVERLKRDSALRHRGWLLLGPRAGRFGTEYLLRAAAATQGLGVNVPREALYPTATTDSAGRPLSGAHRYVVHFAAGQLPPVSAFWSLTLYGPDLFFYPNRLGRYALGDRSRLRTGRDGSLSIAISHSAPPSTTNWLPAPTGRFELALRLYEPRRSVLVGRWPLPRIERVA